MLLKLASGAAAWAWAAGRAAPDGALAVLVPSALALSAALVLLGGPWMWLSLAPWAAAFLLAGVALGRMFGPPRAP